MKHTLLLACTLMAGSAFAQSFNDDGSPKKTTSSFLEYKTNHVPVIQAICDSSAFKDDFEANNINQWTVNNGSPTTTNASPAEGTYCLENTGSFGHYGGLETSFSPSTPNEISWYVKTNDLSVHSGYFVPGDANVTTNHGIIFIYFQANNGLRFLGNSQSHNEPGMVANQWYHIGLRNIDFNTKTLDVYLDSVLLLPNFPFYSQSTVDVSRIHVYNYSGTPTAHYDLIKVGEDNSPSINLVTTNILCNGDTTGAIDLTPSGGTSPYTFNWSTTDTTEDLSNLLAGNYIVTLTDDSGCVVIDSAMITEPTAIAVSTDSMGTILCNGDTTGALYTTASGGTPGYTYLWNTGDTMDFITGITGGSYMLTVTDSNNCQHVETIVQTEPDTIATNATVMPETVNGNDGGIDQTTTGGTSPYTYNWSTGDTLEDLSNLAAGTYTVTITDANGCTEVVTYNVPNNTGISQYSHSNGISIFPNPAKEQVTIRLNQPAAIEVFNAIGERLVYEQAQNKQLQLNVAKLPAGVYLLKAGTTTRKLVIE